MLKLNFTARLAAAVAAFRAKPLVDMDLDSTSTDGRHVQPNVDATSDIVAIKSPKQASREFLIEMVEFAGGGELQWKRIIHSYNQMRVERGWPPIADPILSRFLVEMGCRRRRERVQTGRVAMYEFPLEVVDDLAEAS